MIILKVSVHPNPRKRFFDTKIEHTLHSRRIKQRKKRPSENSTVTKVVWSNLLLMQFQYKIIIYTHNTISVQNCHAKTCKTYIRNSYPDLDPVMNIQFSIFYFLCDIVTWKRSLKFSIITFCLLHSSSFLNKHFWLNFTVSRTMRETCSLDMVGAEGLIIIKKRNLVELKHDSINTKVKP